MSLSQQFESVSIIGDDQRSTTSRNPNVAVVGGALAEIWRIQDRLGRDVIFTSDGRDHILAEHSELASRLLEIQAAVTHPERVARDVKFFRRENYYRRVPASPGWIKVVVNYRPVPPQGGWLGEIITAYPIDRPEPKESRIWP